VTNQTVQAERSEVFAPSFEYEPVQLTEEVRNYPSEWIMPWQSIRRYEQPSIDTPFPLEYAFYLLGDLAGKTVVDLGCKEGLTSLILAVLGANVISVDATEKNLALTAERARANGLEHAITLLHLKSDRIPVDEARADRVLCTGTPRDFDCLTLARQIRRVLKPGGAAAFVQPLTLVSWFRKFKASLQQQPLTLDLVEGMSRAVGRAGRRRKFSLTTRALTRIGVRAKARFSKDFDKRLLRHGACGRGLSSLVVWEARKES
jgi:2-polyprenyl-3-methyl-5-hydroxy-6-metoxy-1,4-benzoquinol methylase